MKVVAGHVEAGRVERRWQVIGVARYCPALGLVVLLQRVSMRRSRHDHLAFQAWVVMKNELKSAVLSGARRPPDNISTGFCDRVARLRASRGKCQKV